jgi:Glycosyl hydrolase family 3 C-terminal domain
MFEFSSWLFLYVIVDMQHILPDVVFGKYKPGGRLPFELPSSMEAVRNQKEDLPHDSKDPLYKFGYGLSY